MTTQEMLAKIEAVQHTLKAFLVSENDPDAARTLSHVIDELAAVQRGITTLGTDGSACNRPGSEK